MKGNVNQSIHTLLKRLNIQDNDIVILNVSNDVDKGLLKSILENLKTSLINGTLCIIGDCGFNSSETNLEELSTIPELNRNVIFRKPILKMFELSTSVQYVKHPSVEIAVSGKHANFLTRHESLDFPYGKNSIFNDLYDMNAIYLSIGEEEGAYPLKYAILEDDAIIKRNVCLYGDIQHSYLDVEFDKDQAADQFKGNTQYEGNSPVVYGERYRYLIEAIRNK